MGMNHEKFVEQRRLLLEGLALKNVDNNTALLTGALVLIADELHRANEREHGVGVFRDCLLRAIANIGRNAG